MQNIYVIHRLGSVPREIVTSLAYFKPIRSFKRRKALLFLCLFCFVFLLIYAEPVRGRQREDNFQKKGLQSQQKVPQRLIATTFLIFLTSLFLLGFDRFVILTSCTLHLEV